MASLTADLEYFQCDLCRTYFHKDIFCPHRRQCKGPGSVELKRDEVLALSNDLDREARTERCAAPNAGLDFEEKVRKDRTRTAVANAYHRRTEPKVSDADLAAAAAEFGF